MTYSTVRKPKHGLRGEERGLLLEIRTTAFNLLALRSLSCHLSWTWCLPFSIREGGRSTAYTRHYREKVTRHLSRCSFSVFLKQTVEFLTVSSNVSLLFTVSSLCLFSLEFKVGKRFRGVVLLIKEDNEKRCE